ncbi:phosphohistidine phosphatase SixA [bacterium SCSIO 12696]|nr:phosphohistidine phosphatase SixA [bacterium SCSIO 12696]
MKLFLLRHGDAASYGEGGERPLTPLGLEQTRRIVAEAANGLNAVESVYSSPKLRARQTAEAAVDAAQLGLQPQVVEQLLPGADINALRAVIGGSEHNSVLLVTHQPLVGKLLDYLTDRSDLGYQMGTSCLACLDVTGFACGGATLQWLKQP